jgi:hypothetical protein
MWHRLCFGIFFLLLTATVAAQDKKGAAPGWTAVREALGRPGMPQKDGGMKFGFPRGDLDVHIGEVKVKPGLALGSWLAFDSPGPQAHVMGDLVLTEKEQERVLRQLAASDIEVTGIHNHLLNETPKIIYIHVAAVGDAVKIAKGLSSALAHTGTPPQKPALETRLDLNEGEIEKIIGVDGRVSGGVLQLSVPRSHGIFHDRSWIPNWMGISSAINFQPLGDGKAAIAGDLVLTRDEVNRVLRILLENNINVTAIHGHMLDERPRMFFMHFWATGDAKHLATALRDTLKQSKH